MKVLHITTSSRGGAGIAAKRLHDALRENGVQSGFLSANQTIDFDNQIVNDSFFAYQKPSFFKKIYLKFEALFFPDRHQKAAAQFRKIKDKLHYEIATLPFSHYALHEHPLVNEADIINLHWVGEFIDYPVFFEHCRKPIVWTFHDMNPFQGIFHYKNDENDNFAIASSFDAAMKRIKAEALKKIRIGAIVTPSRWLLSEAEKAMVFDGFEKTCIPNSIALDVFNIQDKEKLRNEYRLEKQEFVLLFVADSVKNKRKGFDLLLEALSLIKDKPITVMAIGKGEMPKADNLKIISLGEINTAEKMAACYALADLFVLPSREDNLPNVMLESFASGTPIVGFPIGGVAEHVKANLTGVLADGISSAALAKAIAHFYATKENYNPLKIREYAEANFSFKKQADAYMKLYTDILRRNANKFKKGITTLPKQ